MLNFKHEQIGHFVDCSYNWPNSVMQMISLAYYGQLPRMVDRMYETDNVFDRLPTSFYWFPIFVLLNFPTKWQS